MYPLPPVSQTTLRWSFVQGSAKRVCRPAIAQGAKGTREPGEDSGAGAFYYRTKLPQQVEFTGPEYAFLQAIERSGDRCQTLGLQLETRPNPYGLFLVETQARFTCNTIKFDPDLCKATVTLTQDDGYQDLLDHYEKEYNLLLTPTARVTVSAQLDALASGISIETKRVGLKEQPDYLGIEGWTLFLQNSSWIPGPTALDGFRETNNIIFRFRQRAVPLVAVAQPGGGTTYTPLDKSAGGWEVLLDTIDTTNNTIDYVKAPAIAGFKTYKIGTYSNWNDPRNPARVPKYGDELLLIDSALTPADYGYRDSDYIEITGVDGYGANNAECGGRYLNVRRSENDKQCSKLYWRFGAFTFKQGIPLLDGLYNLLLQTVVPYGGKSLLPPSPAFLSDFFSLPLNYATQDQGDANECPRLLLLAGSDGKRATSTEPATRLLLSLKQLLADLSALYDVGWFIDPVTGYFRVEHRAYLSLQRAGGQTKDLTQIPEAILPRAYSYEQEKLPRYEQLVVSNAATQDVKNYAFFDVSSIDYGLSGCVNTKEGSNTVSLTSARLTGDIAAGVLNGDQLPDNCVFLLAPDSDGRITDANRRVAPTNLLQRYYRHGRVSFSATVEGPAPLQLPNSVLNQPPPSGPALRVQSIRPARLQEGQSAPQCTLRDYDGTTHFTTKLAAGGQLVKAEMDLLTGHTTHSVRFPAETYTTPGPLLTTDFSADFTHPTFN